MKKQDVLKAILIFFLEIIALFIIVVIFHRKEETESILLPNGYETRGYKYYIEDEEKIVRCIQSKEENLVFYSRITGTISEIYADKDFSYCILTIETSGEVKEYNLLIESELDSEKEELRFFLDGLNPGNEIIFPTIRDNSSICSCEKKSALYYFFHPKVYRELLESDKLSLDEIDIP